jgi:uncharacterized protein with PQ loop repeat
MQSAGIHHISKRKRITESLSLIEDIEGIGEKTFNKIKKTVLNTFEAYPSDKFWISMLDKLLMVIAIVSPLMTLPQIYQIYFYQSVEGLSFISWASWALFNLPWIAYGFVHKQKPIITMYILWFIMNSSVAVGILLYS